MKKTDTKKGSLATGYALKSVPSWILTVIKQEMMLQKFGPKSRRNRLLIHVMPSDFWKTRGSKAKKNNSVISGGKPAMYRFERSRIAQKYLNLDATTLKEISRQISIKYSKDWGGHPRLITVILPNNVVTGKVKSVSDGKSNVIMGGYCKSTRGEYWDFFDDINLFNRQYPLRISYPVYEANVVIDGVLSTVFSTRKFEPEKEYDFVVYTWYEPQQGMRGRKDNPVYYCFSATEKKEDFTPLYDVGDKITGFDVLSPNWDYDDQTIALLLFNLVYMQEGEPTLNTVLFGGTRLGKSKILEVFAKVFGETIHSGSQQTVKGLTGSFWGDDAKSGALMESRFIHLNDEFFRTGLLSNKPLDQNHIVTLLNGMIEMLEHSKKTASSGKFSRVMFFDKSFLGTNNVRDLNVYHEAFTQDPALFNRLCLLNVPKKVEEKMRSKELIPPSLYFRVFESRLLKAGLNLSIYRKLFMYLRKSIGMVSIDMNKMNKYVKQSDYCHRDYDKREKFYALVRCTALFSYMFSSRSPFPIKKKIVASDKDYRDAVSYMNRIVSDFKQICSQP